MALWEREIRFRIWSESQAAPKHQRALLLTELNQLTVEGDAQRLLVRHQTRFCKP